MLKRLLSTGSRRQAVVFTALSLLVLLTPFGSESSNPIMLGIYRTLLFVIAGVAAAGAKHDRKSGISPYFLWGVGGVLAVMGLSVIMERGSHFEGVYVFYQNALFIAAFIALTHFQRARSIEWKRAILTVVVAINLGFVLSALLADKRPLIGPFVNPNYFASFLLPGIAICLACALFGARLQYRIGALAAASILYFGIVQSSSRGATLAALAMAGVGFLKMARQRGWKTTRILLLGAAVAAVTVVASPVLIQKFMDRGQRDPYNYQRPQIWLSALRMAAAHPVLGVGPGRYSYVSKLFTPAVEGTIARYRKWPNIAHSEYLQYLAEIGIPAALLLFVIGGSLFRTLWKRGENLTGEAKVVQEAALLAAVGLAAHALVDNNWTVPVLAAGLAVISQGDLLPYRPRSENAEAVGNFLHPRFPTRTVLAIACVLIFVQSTLIPTLALYFNESGHRAYIADQFDRAELMHQMAIGMAPDHPVFLDNLGMVYLDQFIRTRQPDFLDQAEAAFHASMAANPSFDIPGGHLETALIQRLTGNVEKDRPIHEKIIEADRHVLGANPFNPFIRKNLAEALYNSGAREEASVELRRAVEMEPNYVPGYLRLSEWSAEAGLAGESEAYKKKAIELALRFQTVQLGDAFDALLLGRPDPVARPQ